MKMSDIKTMSDEEVRGAELNVRQAMFEARMARATGELADSMRLRNLRKDLARILTAQRQRAAAAK